MQRTFFTLSGNFCIALICWAGLAFQVALAQPAVHARSGEIEVTLTVPKVDYQRGEEVQLDFTLSNIGSTPVMIQSFATQLFDFAVYDAQGSLLKTPAFVQKPLLIPPRPQMLQPKEILSTKLPWDLMLPDQEKRSPLTPGRYALQGFINQGQNGRMGFDRQGSSPFLITPLLYITVH